MFSIFKIKTLKTDTKEKDFFHFLNLVSTTDTVLDIGANIGIMSVYLAKKAKKGTVHSFEPIPQNFEILQRIITRFKLQNITLYQFALGNENKKIEMVLPIISSVKMQGLSHVIHESIEELNEGEIIQSTCKTLDSIFENTAVHAIKIDVENFEYFVLKGGENLLKKHYPVIYIELWDNENRTKCFRFFEQLNYSIQVVVNEKLVDYNPKIHNKQNFIIKTD